LRFFQKRLSETQVFFGARARYLYELIGWVTRDETDLHFMNYGYSDGELDTQLILTPQEEFERYSAQLYHAVGGQAPLAGRRVLDIGSGRGGGARHLHSHFGARETIGCDIAQNAIRFCGKVHGGVPGLSFRQGDATALAFADDSFDAVVNVESAHCYTDPRAFFSEVRRVLRPDGAFLLADFTPPRCHPAEARLHLVDGLSQAGFAITAITDVTAHILRGLDADDARRCREIDRRFPRFMRRFARLWAGTRESWIYRDFAEGRRAYLMIHATALPAVDAPGLPRPVDLPEPAPAPQTAVA
jgi:ubiquinone/menaquinone biosynthesis C-methylase UbiE